MLELSPDELLTTTRAVRRRLDLSRNVPRSLIMECLAIAQQAPTATNREGWHFVIVDDQTVRARLASVYRRSLEISYDGAPPTEEADLQRFAAAKSDGLDDKDTVRLLKSVRYLYDHFQDVPAVVVPCIPAFEPGAPSRGVTAASRWGSIVQGAWSFMLAARSRGLGTVYTTVALRHEQECAEILGIPYNEYIQAAHIPVAYTLGTTFKPGVRRPLENMVHWNKW